MHVVWWDLPCASYRGWIVVVLLGILAMGAVVCASKNDMLCPPPGILACCSLGQVLPQGLVKVHGFLFAYQQHSER